MKKPLAIVIPLVFIFFLVTKAEAVMTEVTAGETIDMKIEPINGSNTNGNTSTTPKVLSGVVTEILSESTDDYSESQINLSQEVKVLITKGSNKGETVTVKYERILSQGENPLQKGDQILLDTAGNNSENQNVYFVIDFIRTPALFILFVIFVVMVLAVGKWQGFQSLIGMALSFVILFAVLIPGIKAGIDPILVTIFSSALIMIFTFYLSHGFNQKTTWATIGTLISLILTAALAKIFLNSARLTGFASEEAVFLQFMNGGQLNAQGAINLPLQDIQQGDYGNLEKDQKIYLYCRSGSRSGQATALLKGAGYTNLVDIRTLTAWQSMGGEVE